MRSVFGYHDNIKRIMKQSGIKKEKKVRLQNFT